MAGSEIQSMIFVNRQPAIQNITYQIKQELSYRKQIAHQLHTQYVECTNSNP